MLRAKLAAFAAIAGSALVPGGAAAQSGPGFPIWGQDKFLGSVNDFTQPLFLKYFNEVTPENAGKWGSAAGTSRTAAMRWTQLDQAYNFAQTNGLKFNFHILVWGNQQPTWMSTLPADEQLAEINKWFAAVAERYPKIDYLQVVNEALHDPPDCAAPSNQGNNCAASGNYARALGGANGTDGTGWDWVLNAFRLARHYFPNTKLMLNDYSITSSDSATTQYLQIINILKRENLLDVIGEQGHAFSTTGNMAVHKANLDRLAATGLPIQITELDIDGLASGATPGDVVQLNNFRRIVPVFWEHPAVQGITVWGWRQPNHWRNAQNAPIVLSDNTPKPAALWLYNYVRGIAPVVRADQSFAVSDANATSVGTVQADDWASAMGRPELRTFTWQLTGGGGALSIVPGTGEIRIADQRLLDENTTYPLKVRVSDGFHTSADADVTVVTGDLANVARTTVGGNVPATLALTVTGSAGFGAFTPGVARDYESSVVAAITSTARDAALSVADPATASPGLLVNGAFALAQPVQAAVTSAFAAVSSAPLTIHTYGAPVSNDAVTIRFKQAIGASEPLRTGSYSKTLTFTLSTTAP
jgi:endo-1,4-beta-xylanase